jgi:acyl-coenzyme A thioesterase PaaI-like protein
VLRVGRSILFCEAEVRREDGELVAKGSGTLMPVRAPAEPASSPSKPVQNSV